MTQLSNKIKPVSRQNLDSASYMSYAAVIDDRYRFVRSAGFSSDDFNQYDAPDTRYFKLFFYFKNGTSNNMGLSGGLLAPTWTEQIEDDQLYYYNSAWTYFKINGEDALADKVKQFVMLLSNINTYSPWYFAELSGLDAAIERNQVSSGEDFKLEEQRKSFVIKCMQDSWDNRIGTLLDLYREISFSWEEKKYLLPANLRKFDMGIYIFSTPIRNLHTVFAHDDETGEMWLDTNSTSHIGMNGIPTDAGSNSYLSSFKYLEFHNCEIDYSSAKTGYPDMNNREGVSPEYSITIFYDDCYEERYNEFLLSFIGDILLVNRWSYDGDETDNPVLDQLIWRLGNITENKVPESDNIFRSGRAELLKNKFSSQVSQLANSLVHAPITALSQLGHQLVDPLVSKAKTWFMGNIYDEQQSLSELGNTLSHFASGDILGGVNAWRANTRENDKTRGTIKDGQQPLGDIYETVTRNPNITGMAGPIGPSIFNNL